MMLVKLDGPLHRLLERGNRNVSCGVLFIAAARPVTAVNGSIRIQKKHSPALIIVKLKEAQIDPFHLNDPDANELLFQLLKLRILTNNLFVQTFAGQSRDATKQDQQWFAGFLRASSGLLKIVVNPMRAHGVFERIA